MSRTKRMATRMSSILITGGRVIDPSQNLDRVTNLSIDDGRIVSYDAEPNGQETIIDAAGKIVAPGLVDMHAELREPGREEDETIETGTAAALAGGCTSIACLANTDPPIDTRAGVEFIRHQALLADHCNVFVIACVSKNREGKELAEIGALAAAGAVAFSDADLPISNSELLRRALEYCRMFDKPILNHPEAVELTRGGVMHEGKTSMILGLSGMPAEAEDVMTSRDLRLAEATGGRLHLMNVSCAGSIEMIRRSKARGVVVTAEICPHHFALSDESLRSFDANFKVNPPLRSSEHVAACRAALADESLRSFDANFKVNPPLRSSEHVAACRAALADGTIDVIASGHAPRAAEKKMRELDSAPFGMVSLETMLPLVITELIHPGHLDWPAALAKMTINPARILGIDKGTLQTGADADVTIIDPDVAWTVDPKAFRSKSSNTPLGGRELTGRAEHVIVGGKVKF